MAIYKINWRATIYGQSFVEAKSVEEARKKAQRHEDYDFEEEDTEPDWEIGSITKMGDDALVTEELTLVVKIKSPFASVEDFLLYIEDFNEANKETMEIITLERKEIE